MIERKAYICEHCDKHRPMKKHAYLSKEKAEIHERTCFYNPGRKTCFTCKHNRYDYKGNLCKIGENKNYNQEIEYCKENGIADPDYRYSILPKSTQIMLGCKHWIDAYGVDESEE